MLQKYIAWMQYVLVDLNVRPTFLIRVPQDIYINLPFVLSECQIAPTSKVLVLDDTKYPIFDIFRVDPLTP
jgi:hypothetical protein